MRGWKQLDEEQAALVNHLRGGLSRIVSAQGASSGITFILQATLVCLVAAGVRLLEYPAWSQAGLRLGDEWILGTNDAYFWAAGARGIGIAADLPFSECLAWLSRLLAISPAVVAFWAPVFFSGLTGAPVLLWSRLLGSVHAGVPAALMTVLAPRFFDRTRLGYYDTDLVTVLFPLLISWFLAFWIDKNAKPTWPWQRKTVPHPEDVQPPGGGSLFSMALAGVLTSFFIRFHVHVGSYTCVVLFLALACALFLCGKENRGLLIHGFALFAICAFAGLPGFAGALVLLALYYKVPVILRMVHRSAWLAVVVIFFSLYFSGTYALVRVETDKFLNTFIKDAAQLSLQEVEEHNPGIIPHDTVFYPGVGQSIKEAQNVSFAGLLEEISLWRWLALLSLPGFCIVLIRSPLALFLLPLAAFALLSTHFGERLAMFGGPIVGLGLALPLFRGFQVHVPVSYRKGALLAGFGLLGVLIVVLGVFRVLDFKPTPVLSKAHARAYKELGDIAPSGAMVWTWWDWGYCVNYYAGLRSYADGGRHLGQHLYPLALALTTSSSRQSNQLIRYTAENNYEPWRIWSEKGAQDTQKILQRLATEVYDFVPPQEQYLVVSLQALLVSRWISFYGTWDVASSQGRHAAIARIHDPYEVDLETGVLRIDKRDSEEDIVIKLRSLDKFSDKMHVQHFFPGEMGHHLIKVEQPDTVLVVDDTIYNSMLFRLLFLFPEDLESELKAERVPNLPSYFKLVYEDYPLVRVYNVLSPKEKKY